MGWVRLHKRYGAWLAVAAMALQLAVSFGHVHLHGIGRGAAAAIASVHVKAVPQNSGQAPARDSDDYCPICATISLLGTSFAAAAPLLPLPVVSHAVEHAGRAALAVIVPRSAPYQSRAPPAA
jgi:hypothetical protein